MSSIGTRIIESLDHWVVDHSLSVIIAFLLITSIFATGLGNISMESGTEQFSEDVPAFDTYDKVDEKFDSPFAEDQGTTQLIQSDENVLSRDGLLHMLRALDRMEQRSDLRVESTASAAGIVAQKIDPTAETTEEKIRAIEGATSTEIRNAVWTSVEIPQFANLLSDDFNPKTAYASATLGVVDHAIQEETSSVGSGGEVGQLADIQLETRRMVDTVEGNIRVYGSGILNYENSKILSDSLQASVPAVVILLILFLIISFRDPFDLIAGVVSLALALIWTFGFMGVADIPFTQLLVSLPPLLLAIGVDFGMHAINRYREQKLDGYDYENSMHRAYTPLVMAFFLVTGTSVIGFSANMASGLGAIRDFGLVAAVGIASVALIFGVFLPALKLQIERIRRSTPLPVFDRRPLGSEGSVLGQLLPLHLKITGKAPKIFLAIILVSAAFSGYYGKDVDSSFDNDDFLPPEDLADYFDFLPEFFQPGSYSSTELTNFLEDNFETSDSDTVEIYAEGSMRKSYALESIHRAGRDPPSTFTTDGRYARSESIITVIRSYAQDSSEFGRLVQENDQDGNGIPDQNLEAVYDELMESPYGNQARKYLTEDYDSTRVVYQVDTDASMASVTADASVVADNYRLDAVETGGTVVFQRVADTLFTSAVTSLGLALIFASIFLVLIFYLLEGRAELGFITLLPIVLAALFLVGTMRHYNIPFNTLTATILSITIGVGIDYSIHVVHRFVDEYKEGGDPYASAVTTLQGTGGALFGSMLTTISGAAALYFLSITPLLKQFGLLMSLSVGYSFIASVVVLPLALFIWADWEGSDYLAESQI